MPETFQNAPHLENVKKSIFSKFWKMDFSSEDQAKIKEISKQTIISNQKLIWCEALSFDLDLIAPFGWNLTFNANMWFLVVFDKFDIVISISTQNPD